MPYPRRRRWSRPAAPVPPPFKWYPELVEGACCPVDLRVPNSLDPIEDGPYIPKYGCSVERVARHVASGEPFIVQAQVFGGWLYSPAGKAS
jgi:hypothetical protein